MSVTVNEPGPEKIVWANWPTNSIVAALAGGNLPLNRPVAGSIVGSTESLLTVTPRPSIDCVRVAALSEVGSPSPPA